jgi:SAM-dependent methyltransferase
MVGHPDDEDAPDIVRGWDMLADAYQAWVGWPEEELTWGLRCPPERDLHLVDDVVPGARTLVLGCGGGQDLVALAALGAGELIGTDPSAAQLAHARGRLDDAGLTARLLAVPAEDLVGIDDASVDLAVSVQALDYVRDLDACVSELRRVLRPGGTVALSVLHPADLSTDEAPPHGWHTPYWRSQRDWTWDGLADADVELRSWFRPPSTWFTSFTDGGLVVERLLEPPPVDDRRWLERGWLDEAGYRKMETVPGTILLRARRPG